MKKLILLCAVCLITHLSFAQDLVKLDQNDFNNRQFIENNDLGHFKFLATKAEVGVAYLNPNSIKTFNTESGINLIRIKGNNISELNRTLDFANSVEMIIIDVIKPSFNIESLDCSKLKQFKNLKYIFYRYQIDIKNNNQLQKLNCLPLSVKQYYSNQLPS